MNALLEERERESERARERERESERARERERERARESEQASCSRPRRYTQGMGKEVLLDGMLVISSATTSKAPIQHFGTVVVALRHPVQK